MITHTGLAGPLLLLLFTAHAVAQPVWSEDFDEYRSGSDLDGQGGWTSAGGSVSSAVASSLPNALAIDALPVSPAGDDAVQDHSALDLTSGVWAINASVYVPSGHTGASYFLLLNTFEDGGATNWSTQVHFNGADEPVANKVVADFGGESLDLVTDRWVPLRVVIDLDAGEDAGDGTPVGHQRFFYDGLLLFEGAWRGHVSGLPGSTQNIAATVLFNNLAGIVYYDDLSIEPAGDGACCLEDGTCMDGDGVDAFACAGRGGVFQGVGTTCATSVCYALSPDGWVVELPDDVARPGGWTWGATTGHVDTCDETDDCRLGAGRDTQWVITFSRDAEYIISACDAAFDSILALGSTPCSDDVAVSDDASGCGAASEIRHVLTAGTYYLTLDGFSPGACGAFTINIREQCRALDDNPDAVAEAEPCGEDTNGGCNTPAEAFEAIECGTTVRGTGWFDGATRDTDWYELSVAEAAELRVSGVAERVGWIFLIFGAVDPDCTSDPSFSPSATLAPCFEGAPAIVEHPVTPGRWWILSTPSFDTPFACGDLDGYEMTVTCGDRCTPSAVGDTDGDGFTDFVDLLNVLARWGVCPPNSPCIGDIDCNGSVDFVDLLTILANWNPPP